MIGQGLRQLQEALNRKAGAVQHEFNAVAEKLQALSRRIAEARGADPAPLIAEQEALREQQRILAGEVNLWRDRARGALRQESDEGMFIVPYSTQGNPYEVRATGQYHIAGTSQYINVTESDVIQGNRVAG